MGVLDAIERDKSCNRARPSVAQIKAVLTPKQKLPIKTTSNLSRRVVGVYPLYSELVRRFSDHSPTAR
jgi:hypothetical protein